MEIDYHVGMVKKGVVFLAALSALIILVCVSILLSRITPQSNLKFVLGDSPTISPTHLYPDPTMTPGDVFPDVSLSALCTQGYTKSVRNVSVSTKREVYQEYGLSYPQPRGAYEVDHFIPLELGGSNDIKNLWPEEATPVPGFHEKDVVENYLHAQVCNGKEDLTKAQEEIRSDWYVVYRKIPNPQDYKSF